MWSSSPKSLLYLVQKVIVKFVHVLISSFKIYVLLLHKNHDKWVELNLMTIFGQNKILICPFFATVIITFYPLLRAPFVTYVTTTTLFTRLRFILCSSLLIHIRSDSSLKKEHLSTDLFISLLLRCSFGDQFRWTINVGLGWQLLRFSVYWTFGIKQCEEHFSFSVGLGLWNDRVSKLVNLVRCFFLLN